VLAYFAAINARDWAAAWRLGGDRIGSGYQTMVAGYAAAGRYEIGPIRVTGDQVAVQVRVYREHAGALTYLIDCTVRDGVITAVRRGAV
jgi:hypothetical protein